MLSIKFLFFAGNGYLVIGIFGLLFGVGGGFLFGMDSGDDSKAEQDISQVRGKIFRLSSGGDLVVFDSAVALIIRSQIMGDLVVRKRKNNWRNAFFAGFATSAIGDYLCGETLPRRNADLSTLRIEWTVFNFQRCKSIFYDR